MLYSSGDVTGIRKMYHMVERCDAHGGGGDLKVLGEVW